MDTNIATIIAAGISMVGMIASVYIQTKNSKATTQSLTEQRALSQAANAERETAKSNAEVAKLKLDQQFNDIQTSIQGVGKKVDDVQKDLEGVKNDIGIIHGRIDKLTMKFNTRMKENDDNVNQIVKVLTRNARQYSLMMRMHTQTEASFNKLMQVQSGNVTYLKSTGNHIIALARLLGELTDNEEKIREVDLLCNQFSATHDEFISAMIKNTTPVAMLAPETDTLISKEEEAIEALFRDNASQPDIDDIDGFKYGGSH